MTIEEKLVALLNTVPLIAARIYPVTGKELGPVPYVVYSVVHQEPFTTHDQALQTTRKWCFQISCFSPVYSEVRAVATAVKTALVGYRDPAGAPGVQAILLTGERTLWEDDTKYYHIPVEVDIYENLV